MRGHLRKRGTTWSVVIDLGRDPDTGLRRQKWFSHRTRKEAETHLAHLLTQIHGGGTVSTTRITVGDYLDRWLSDYAAGAVAVTTLKSYRETISLHFKPILGDISLIKLSPQRIQGYYSKKLTDGLSATTVSYHHRVLRQALHHAVRWGLLARNPCDMVDPPKRDRPEPKVWNEKQVMVFLEKAKKVSPYYRLYLAAVTTGMRQGELLGLRWHDVDLSRKVAHVRQTFYRMNGQQLFKEPKSVKSRRAIPLASILIDELLDLREEQSDHRRLHGSNYEDHDLIFCQPTGRPLHAQNILRRDYREVIKQAKLPLIRFHDLRHCHATLLLNQGVHPKVVSERLGHSSIAITIDTYSHVLPGIQEAAMRDFEQRLFKGKFANILLTGGKKQGGKGRK